MPGPHNVKHLSPGSTTPTNSDYTPQPVGTSTSPIVNSQTGAINTTTVPVAGATGVSDSLAQGYSQAATIGDVLTSDWWILALGIGILLIIVLVVL